MAIPVFPPGTIDYHDPQWNKLLSSLQGNILKGHGRDHTTNIFVRFKAGKESQVKQWIADFTENILTSAIEQLEENEIFKAKNISGGLFGGLYLSATGYAYLQLDRTRFDPAFANGMKSAGSRLQDPPTTEWEAGLRGQIDMFILLAEDDQEVLASASKTALTELAAIADIEAVEYGHAIRNAHDEGLEHNGYADGISQPLYFDDDIATYKTNNPGPIIFDPSASMDLALAKDPFGPNDDDFGSYFVFRKLEQNVRGFREAEDAVGDALKAVAATKGLHFGEEDIERAGAMLVGRYEDGTPVTVDKFDHMINADTFNNFDYTSDAAGAKCPFHAHVRKSNPRRNAADKIRRLTRRAIPFGLRDVNTDTDPLPIQSPQGGVGLLFQCFQKNIEQQFEFIQINWVNNPNFPAANQGSDPLIGQNPHGPSSGFKSTGPFPMEYDNNNPNNFSVQTFNSFIKLKGGEYFFAPSISFLLNLG